MISLPVIFREAIRAISVWVVWVLALEAVFFMQFYFETGDLAPVILPEDLPTFATFFASFHYSTLLSKRIDKNQIAKPLLNLFFVGTMMIFCVTIIAFISEHAISNDQIIPLYLSLSFNIAFLLLVICFRRQLT